MPSRHVLIGLAAVAVLAVALSGCVPYDDGYGYGYGYTYGYPACPPPVIVGGYRHHGYWRGDRRWPEHHRDRDHWRGSRHGGSRRGGHRR